MRQFVIAIALCAVLLRLSAALCLPMTTPRALRMQVQGPQGDARSTAAALRTEAHALASLGGKALLSTITAAGLSAALPSLASARASAKVWEKVELPVRETLFDISFDPSRPEHGWVVGAKGTFLETFDEGKTWATRSFSNLDEDEDINYRFEVASLNDNEGWIIGKPAIMLHTR